jgi:hypothetical protein
MNTWYVDSLGMEVKVDFGGTLRRRFGKMSPAARALLACEAESGNAALSGLTRRQSSRLFQVSHGYVATVSRLSGVERDRLRVNPSLLTQFHNKREPTDSDVDAFIARAGADQVLAALDRLTAPPKVPSRR